MIISTKFDLGDTVYFMKDNTVFIDEIIDIRTDTSWENDDIENDATLTIVIYHTSNFSWIPEQLVFKTKKELLDSL